MRKQTTILILSLTVWLSTFAQGDPIRVRGRGHGTRTHGNISSSRTRYKRRRTTVIELENNGGGKKGGKGKTTKHGDVKGAAKPKYKKATKGEENHDDSEDSSSHYDSEDVFSQDDSEDVDEVQTNAPTKQPSHVPNSDLSALSLSKKTAKTSKKRKKSKSDDSHKNSSKLSKKSKMSSSKAPVVSPPTDETGSPTAAPTPSSSSTLTRHLTPYGLEYTVTEDDRIPFRSELLEVVEVTKEYLNRFFEDHFEGEGDIILDEFQTIFTDTESDFGDPVYVAYKSSAIFNPSSSSIPTTQELDTTLTEAFQGQNLDGYLGMLQALPPNNLFSTTTFVMNTEVREKTRSSSAAENKGPRPRHSNSTSGSTATAGIAAGVTGLTLMAAAGLVHRRKAGPSTRRDLATPDCDIATVTTGIWSLDQGSALQPLEGYSAGLR